MHPRFRNISPICKLAYIARHWNGLRILLDYGRVELDSDYMETSGRYRIPSARSPRKSRFRQPASKATAIQSEFVEFLHSI